jgi:hypothetical protein
MFYAKLYIFFELKKYIIILNPLSYKDNIKLQLLKICYTAY